MLRIDFKNRVYMQLEDRDCARRSPASFAAALNMGFSQLGEQPPPYKAEVTRQPPGGQTLEKDVVIVEISEPNTPEETARWHIQQAMQFQGM